VSLVPRPAIACGEEFRYFCIYGKSSIVQRPQETVHRSLPAEAVDIGNIVRRILCRHLKIPAVCLSVCLFHRIEILTNIAGDSPATNSFDSLCIRQRQNQHRKIYFQSVLLRSTCKTFEHSLARVVL